MKKTKHIIIAAIAVSVITLGAVVACNKEHNTLTETNVPSTKKNPDEKALLHYVRTIWQKSDSTITKNPTAVGQLCITGNISEFLTLANIPNSIVDSAILLYEKKMDNASFPSAYSFTACNDCHQLALSNYVDQCTQLRKVLNDIHLYEPTFNDTLVLKFIPYVTECEYNCMMSYRHSNQNPTDLLRYFLCMINCDMTIYIDDANEILYDLMYQNKPIED